MVEAKAKVKIRHKTAIEEFLKWRKNHPKATTAEQVEMFDFLVDAGRQVKDAA